MSRREVPIAGATAGSNADRAWKSYDDNEETHWDSDGQLGTAWIQYDFAVPAAPNEAVMKLMSWRNRSYPIRITVDGQEVFAGATPISYGYVHLPLRPVSGSHLRIELTAPARGRDGITIKELGNARDPAASGLGLKNAETLSISEIEIYQPLR
jgi:hypothetical protein